MAKKSRFRSAEGSAEEEMRKRTEESERRKGGTDKWNDYLVDDFEGEKFVANEGDHLVDIIPYLTGPNDPKLEEGSRAYMLDVYAHQKVGLKEDSVLCPSANWRGRKCPICEHQAAMKQSGQFTEYEIRELNAKRRCLYNVVVLDTQETENKGVQVWEASYHLTEKEILAIARNRRGGGFIPFADPDNGRSISFFREGKGKSTEYKGYQFVDREDIISDEILDDAYCLDELLDIKTYEEIEEMFRPTAPEIVDEDSPRRSRRKPADEEEEEEPPRRSRRPRNDEEEEEEPPRRSRRTRSEEEEEKEPPRRSRRKPADEEEEEEEEQPRKSRVRGGKKNEEEEEEEEQPRRSRRKPADEEEEEEEEQPRRSRRTRRSRSPKEEE